MPNTRSWKPSHALDHDLRTNPEFVAMLVGIAEPIAEVARSIAPVGGDNDPHAGDYKAGIEVQVRTGSTGRKRVAVVATDFKSLWIEFGNSKMAAHGTLRKAARLAFGKGKRGLGGGQRIGSVRSRRKK